MQSIWPNLIVQQTLRKFPEVITTLGMTGRAEVAIDPVGKDTNDMRDMIRALEAGSEPLGLVALRDPDAKAMLGDLKKQFGEFEKNVSPILRELQKLVSARQANSKVDLGRKIDTEAKERIADGIFGARSLSHIRWHPARTYLARPW